MSIEFIKKLHRQPQKKRLPFFWTLPKRPRQTVVVVSGGQDGLFQTLYLQKWPKSGFEIVVMVEERIIAGRMLPMVTRCSQWYVVILPLLRYRKSRKSRSDEWREQAVRSQKVYKCAPCVLPKKCPLYGEREAWSSGEQDSTEVPDFAFRAFCPIGILLGSAFPQPCPTQPDGCGNLAQRQSFTSSIAAQGYKKFGKTGVKIALPMPTQ